jgi:hypothetical protein
VCLIDLRNALGDERPTNPDIRPDTFELLTYQATDYRFLVIPVDETPPAGFEQPGFDDTDFRTGSAAFGAGEEGAGDGIDCPLRSTVHTDWPLETQLLVRRVVSIPEGATNVRIMVSVDNDIIGVFVNGTRIAKNIRHGECPILDEFRFDVPQELVQPGQNLVAFHVKDRPPEIGPANESFFDARILAELSLDQVPEAVAVPQVPLVPVRDVAVDFRVDPDSVQRALMIPYAVAATGEFGEITIEQISEDTLTAAIFLGNELIGFGTATPDTVTTSRSSGAADRLADLDPGILSGISVFANQTALEGLFRFSAAPAGASCEETCNRKAARASLIRSMMGGMTTGGSLGNINLDPATVKALFLNAAPEAAAHKSIEALRKECLAGCMETPPVPPPDPIPPVPPRPVPPAPGTLSGAVIFNADRFRQPIVVTARFEGRLVQGLEGGTGMMTFRVDTPMMTVANAKARSIGFSQGNLRAGTWSVAVGVPGIAVGTCPNARRPNQVIEVPPGGLEFIRIRFELEEPAPPLPLCE